MGKIYNALQSQISSFISDYRRYGQTYAINNITPDGKMESAIRSIYRYVTPIEAGSTLADLRKRYPPPRVKRASFGFSQTWNDDVKRYLDRYLLDKAVLPITETTKNQILFFLRKGIDEGWGVDRIVKELGESDITKSRALKIVRTETVRATNIGRMIGAYDSDYEQVKEWVAVDDARTRRTHSHAQGVDGEKRDLLKPFSNGLMYPGDPNALAKEVINCRCSVTFRVKRDENGKPILKQRSFSIRNNIIDLLLIGFIQGVINNVMNEMSAE